MTPRVLDVRSDDLATAMAVLQRLGVALFGDVFDSPGGFTPDRWFEWPEARVLDRIPLGRLGWRRLVARVAPVLSDAVTDRRRWIGSSPSRLRWSDGAVRARLAIDAHGVEGHLIPDRLLGLLARAAWESADFRLQASTLVLDHFRSRLIASADGPPVPHIEPGLVWLMIATARITPPASVRLGWTGRAEHRALARLQRFAHGVLDDTALPDDFWSQWIAWHVERRYGQRAKLPPAWHSRLSAADRPGAAGVAGVAGVAMSHPLAAVYAAWYPGRERKRAPRRSGAGHGAPASDGVVGPRGEAPGQIDRRVARVRPGSPS